LDSVIEPLVYAKITTPWAPCGEVVGTDGKDIRILNPRHLFGKNFPRCFHGVKSSTGCNLMKFRFLSMSSGEAYQAVLEA
jgi:hypothetical protein